MSESRAIRIACLRYLSLLRCWPARRPTHCGVMVSTCDGAWWRPYEQKHSAEQRVELTRQLTVLQNQQDRLLNLRLLEEIDESTFAAKNTEFRDRIAQVKLQLETCDRRRTEHGEIAVKAFELSQTLREKWLTADYQAKRRLLDIVCLNLRLDGVSLVPTIRKPFDVLAEGLTSVEHRGDWIRTSDLCVPNAAL